MTEPPIPQSAIEAAARAFEAEVGRISGSLIYAENPEQDLPRKLAEAALRAAFDDLGMEREEQIAPIDRGGSGQPYECLVSRWMPVEESSDLDIKDGMGP